ncbi:MAG TPA: SDR family oxidoreductase [Polyangiales bacterium]|jgi:NADP-dependent 3-hydroxy acid dehydrogenase YdfG|nr:SDR family oxidoreductase [Polyangiales bacterium]
MKDQVVVITGASSGIGAVLAEVVSQRGGRPVLVARRETQLREVAARCGPQAFFVVADVTVRAQVVHVLRSAREHYGHVDVWVNNAGRGISRSVQELDDEDLDEMMRVNVKSALYGMQAVLPHFKERGRGHIINVSSMLGRLPFVTFRSAYAASKHALNSLTANLRMELRATHPEIHVSSVHPGIVATEFGINARHGGFDSRTLPGAQSAEDVAAVIADVIEHPRADVYTRAGAHEMVAAYYAAPDMGQAEQAPPFVNPPRPPRAS